MSTLQTIWFVLIGVLLLGYSLLDGFDLGVGLWYLGAKDDQDRRMLLAAIGPVWDGNEVWLLTGGGALFAAFPHVYATVFSGFYLALILVLMALIFRAVALEFRSKEEARWWRTAWDWAFSVGSIVAIVLFGVALGNVLRGVPLDEHMTYTGTFFTLLNPYALLVGATGTAMLATHGALYAALKTEGPLHERARRWANLAWPVFVALLLAADVATLVWEPHLVARVKRWPVLWVVPVAVLALAVVSGLWARRGEVKRAFLGWVGVIALVWAQVGLGLYPNLLPALGDQSLSLTISNASSSKLTLEVMLVLALVGMPLVVAYNVWVYKVFSGKAEAGGYGY